MRGGRGSRQTHLLASRLVVVDARPRRLNTSYPRLAVENPVDADSAFQQGAPAGGRLIKPAHLADVGGYSSYFADPMGISGK